MVKSLHEKAGLVVDGQAEGPARRDHSLGPKKMLGFAEQRREDGMVVDRVDKAEEAAAVGEFLLMRRRHGRHDPADGFAVSKCDKWLNQILSQERRERRLRVVRISSWNGSTHCGLIDWARRPAAMKAEMPARSLTGTTRKPLIALQSRARAPRA